MVLMSTLAVTVWGEVADNWIYHHLVICPETISVLTRGIITQSKILWILKIQSIFNLI